MVENKKIEKHYSERRYLKDKVVTFRKTDEEFGGLSNMCTGYPIKLNGLNILHSESLYQACRFPDMPDIQKLIIDQKSPMTAKMKSKPYRKDTREDWEEVKIKIMQWCIRVKLAQNFFSFGLLLEKTYPKSIVEESHKDKFWGAMLDKNDENLLIGVNALGRLLMELREKYISTDKYSLLLVEPPVISNFKLNGVDIPIIDAREDFIKQLNIYWSNMQKNKSKVVINKPEKYRQNSIFDDTNSNANNRVDGLASKY